MTTHRARASAEKTVEVKATAAETTLYVGSVEYFEYREDKRAALLCGNLSTITHSRIERGFESVSGRKHAQFRSG